METIACRTSSTATRVRLQYFCTTLDLPYQHSVVSTCIPLAFPDATRVQLGPWIEWKKNESGEWTPGLHDERAEMEIGPDREASVWEFVKFVRESGGVRDYEGFLKGLGLGVVGHVEC